jgi:hypothetical protein
MAYRQVLLKGSPVRKEAAAAGAITPGHLIQIGSAGTAVVHATAGGDARRIFALERDLEGYGIDDDYASGDEVFYADCRPGDEVAALVAASAEAIEIGDPLESAADGTLRKHTATSIVESGSATKSIYTQQIVAFAGEAVDNSSGASEARIKAVIA